MISVQDQKLLGLLRQNARASVTDLAKAMHVSRSTIQSRMAKLEAQGVIRGYTVQLGGEYAANQVEAHVSVKVHQKLTARTNAELEQIAQVSQLFSVSGEYVLDDIGNLEGVERTNSAVVLETRFRR
jgi:DNA-binding Lrp family transcriptional regulator